MVVGFWSRGLPVTSLAPVVTTALYLAPLVKFVVEVPKGLSVALTPSVLRLTVSFVTWIVPLEVILKSLKVWALKEEVIIFSVKVAVRLVDGSTPVVLAVGTVLMTLGAVHRSGS
jgi:hypothetical protein